MSVSGLHGRPGAGGAIRQDFQFIDADPWPASVFICVGFRVQFGGITQVSKSYRHAIRNTRVTPLSITVIYVTKHMLFESIHLKLLSFTLRNTDYSLAFEFSSMYAIIFKII